MRETDRVERQPPVRRPLRYVGYFLAWWAVLFGIWIVLVDSLEHPEYVAGPVAAVLAAMVALGLRVYGGVRFRPRLGWLQLLAPVPGGVLRDCGVLLLVLWRRVALRQHPPAAFRAVHFPAVADDPESAAWRAFVTIVTSTTPNTFVVGVDKSRGTILVHQLVPDDSARLRRSVVGSAPGRKGSDS